MTATLGPTGSRTWREATLKARARRLAERSAAADETLPERCLVCAAREALFAFQLAAIRRVEPFHRAARLPGADAATLGVVKIAGELRTIVDLKRALGDSGADAAGGYLLVLRALPACLRVDEALAVADLVRLDADDVRESLGHPALEARALARGQFDDRTITLVNPRPLLGEPYVDR